MKIKDTEALKR